MTRFVTSHDSAYHSVAQGIYPAGGGIVRTLNNIPAEISDQLRILWRTDSYTPHALAAHPRVAETVQEALIKALCAMDSDPKAADILRNISLRGWEPGQDKDWDDLRKLHFDVGDAEIEQ